MASQMTAKHHGSKLRFLPVSSSNMAFVNGDLKKSIATRPDGSVLHSNHSVTLENLSNSKYFIIDHESYMFCTITQCFRDLSSLTTFMKSVGRPQRIYLRRIPISTFKNDVEYRVFTDDVLEMIPILLERQHAILEPTKDLLQTFQEKWKSDDRKFYNTISLLELVGVLEEFDINKNLLTICPDAVYESTSHNMFLKGTNPIVLYSPDGGLVMDITQAVFYTFQSVICGINLNVKVCKICQSDKCMDNYKAEVLAAMKEYSNLREGSYVVNKEVSKKIDVLKTHCSFINQKNFPKQDYMMVNEDIMKREPLKVYQNIIDSYEIPEDIRCPNATGPVTAPVWAGRYVIMKAWSNNFFGSTNTSIKMLVLDGLLQKVPKDMKCAYELEHIKLIEHDCFENVDDGRPMQLSDIFGGTSDKNPQSSLSSFSNLMQNCSITAPVVKKNNKKDKKNKKK